MREPILPPAMWSNRSPVSGVGLILVATALLVAVFFLNTIYLQVILGWWALETGLGFLPLVLVIGVAANVATKLIPRIGSRNVAVLGLLLVGAGATLLVLVPEVASYGLDVLPGFVLGFGVGDVFPAASISAHPGSRLTIGGTSAEDTIPRTPCRVSRLLRVGSNTRLARQGPGGYST